MRAPANPPNEADRIDTLRGYAVLDTLPEQSLDDIAALAAHICQAPISLISLVDDHRQWFKSRIGVSFTETPRDVSFCGHAILAPDLFVVPNALEDEAFVDNPLVTGETQVRFYAGAPLTAPNGHKVGALCVMDRVPRELTASQREALRVLSRQAVAQLELRRQTRIVSESEERLRRVFNSCPVAVSVTRTRDRVIVDINPAFTELLGWTHGEIVGQTLQGAGVTDDATFADMRAAWIRGGGLRSEEFPFRTRDGQRRHVLLSTEFVELQGEPHMLTTFVDVSERREADLELRRLAAIVEYSDDAIIGKNLDGIITSWNRGAQTLFGYSAAEMIGASIRTLIPDERQGEEDFILECIAAGESVEHFETVRRTRGGGTIDVSVTASPIRDATGTVVGVSKIARNITARKKADAVLLERDEQLRLYAEHSPAAVAMFDREMRYLVASRRWMEDFVPPGERVIGRSHYEIFPDLPQAWKDVHQRCLAGAVESKSQDAFQRADGSTLWMRWEVRPWRRADGSIGGVIIFAEDTTEHRNALAAVQTAEERMRFALESAEVGIWDFEPLTGVVRWSPVLEAQYGLEPGSFEGTFQAFMQLVHPDDRTSVLARVEQAMRTGSDFSIQHRAVRPDGSVRWLDGRGRIYLGSDGQPLRGLGISIDVTDRRSLEAQYQQAQKMEAVGRLAGGIAHDFNNLLTAILGYCELLLADLAADDPIHRDIRYIQKAGTSAAQLTKQLLTFSRKQIIEPKLIDLNVVVADVQGMISRLIGEDVSIVLGLSPQPAVVMADRGQLEQVLVNLAVNARDAMPKGGVLTIETAHVDLDGHYADTHFGVEAGSYTALVVTDTGIGMSAEVREHLFEPFFTTKEPGKGTGLGLATVHGIVARSGGSIGVYSEIGRGTSFKVYFPRQRDGATAPKAPEATLHFGNRRPRVLVVEDEHDLRALACRLLDRLGCDVFSADDASAAFDAMEIHAPIDVVLSDVVMPGISGPELMKQLSAQFPGLKAIYMSGYTEDTIVHHGVLRSGISFLHKPFTLDALARKLHEALDG